jgi:hypothetical protein
MGVETVVYARFREISYCKTLQISTVTKRMQPDRPTDPKLDFGLNQVPPLYLPGGVG